MNDDAARRAAPSRAADSIAPVLGLALGLLALRVLYLVALCPYELVEDEAQYWLWAQHPGWSYYSKGPGVAWVIWLSTAVLGDAEWAVRLPAALLSAAGAVGAGLLGRDLARWAGARAVPGGPARATPAAAGLGAAAAYALTPALQMAGLLMTIDGPYVACWTLAAWASWRALTARPAWWVAAGLLLAAGFLFKYTMALLVPGLLLGGWWLRRGGTRTFRPGAWGWLGLGAALSGFLPVILWNAGHGWATVRHLLGHLGVAGGDMPVSAGRASEWSPLWVPELIGTQLVFGGPWLVLGSVAAWRSLRPPRGTEPDPGAPAKAFLGLCAAPIALFYLAVALIAEPEANWPMAAMASLMPLAGWAAADGLARWREARRAGGPTPLPPRLPRRLWRWGIGYALGAALLLHGLFVFADLALALNRAPWFRQAFSSVARREPQDPAGRLRGSRDRAAHVLELAGLLRSRTGRTPFILAQHYGTATQLAYALRGAALPEGPGGASRPLVLCASAHTGGRRSQYDLWDWARLDNPDLLGRPAVIVSPAWALPAWEAMFERVEPIPGQRLRGEHKPDRSAYLGYGYRGVASKDGGSR